MKKEEEKAAWYSVFSIATAIILVSLLVGFVDRVTNIPTTLLIFRSLSIFIAVSSIAILLRVGKKASMRLLTILFLSLVLPLYPIMWIAQSAMANSGLPWMPFIGHKIAFLVIALCAVGPTWLSGALMAGMLAHAIGLWFWHDLGSRPWIITTGEPAYTIGFALVGGVLLIFRQRYLETMRLLADSQAKGALLAQMTKMFLTMRDKSNSPLQTFEIQISLLKAPNADVAKGVERMEKALASLKNLNLIYNELESHVIWDGNEIFDIPTFLKTFSSHKK